MKHTKLLALIVGLSCTTLSAQTIVEKEQITKNYNQTTLKNLQQNFQNESTNQKKAAIQLAQQKGWPIRSTLKDGSLVELQVIEQGQPIYFITHNTDAARSTRTDHLHSGGSLGLNLNGQNMTAHVWDGGLARASHQEYDGAGGNNRFSVGDGTTATHYHAAHVTGTIISSGVQASAKGMAPHGKAVGYDWNNDRSEATTAASNGMLLSNHSYGYRASSIPDYYFGAYISVSRNWDEIMYNAPQYLMVTSAGNDGNDNSSNGSPLNGNASYDKLNGAATAKNNLVIANAQDANVDNNGNLISVAISSSSSEGPTDDLRIKPDIAGNGSGVYSTFDSSDAAYNSISGTSMSSPNVCGSLLLLQQHYNNSNGSYMRAATLKGLALHTADDAGSNGPDAVFGWGLLNTKAAAQAISQNGNQSKIEERTLNANQTYSITVQADGSTPLMASISWTDPAGTANTGTANATTSVLVNDLDIRVTKSGTTYNPWRLTGITTNGQGDNTKDPYERVDVNNASGTYTITVTHKGSLTNNSQNYSLIITGITNQTQTCTATTPTGLNSTSITSNSATINWNAVNGTTYTARYRKTGTTNWTTVNASTNTTNLSGLEADSSYEVQVRSICPDNSTSSFSSSHTFTTATTASSCPNAVTAYPYTESFENTIGAWTQNTDDDFNWTTRSGSTPSSNTGPSSANSGSYYLYMESSSPNYSNKKAIITSPCFDLTAVTDPSLNFKYHMYGSSNMGNLVLEASTDGTTWTTVWSKTGNQGNSWQTATVDLSTYSSSNSLKLRFNGTTGTTWQGDMAVDALNINSGGTGGSCHDIVLTINLDNYPEETSWTIKDGSNTTVASGGTYQNQADGATVTIQECLPTGCYTLTINDSYGDGICCGYGNGSYTLTETATGSTLASGGSFGSTDVTNFCLGNATNNYVTHEDTKTEGTYITISPSPVSSTLYIKTNISESFNYQLINIQGQVVQSGNMNHRLEVSNLPSGIYIMKLRHDKKEIIKKIIKK